MAREDATEQVMKQIEENYAGFVIRYEKQPHGGKHRAVNRGVTLAKGKYFLLLTVMIIFPLTVFKG